MIVYARMMSGKVFTFELDVSTFIYKVKKLRYMLSRASSTPSKHKDL
jgi:hypothetical protein